MREASSSRWASEPHIALGTMFASAQAAVAAVQLFARTVQRRSIRLQYPVSSNSNRTGTQSDHVTSATLKNQFKDITIGCENGSLGCPWTVGLTRVDSVASPSSLPSSQYRVSFLELSHDERHCTELQNSSPRMDDEAELRLHQLFAPAPISNSASSSHELVSPVGSGLPEAFFQHQVGASGFIYFPSLSTTPTAAHATSDRLGLDGFELEKYAINHVASSFAPSPMAGPTAAMLFDMGATGGFTSPLYHHQHSHHQQQTWDASSGFQSNLQQHHHHGEYLDSGHSTPLGSEAARVGIINAAKRSHRDSLHEPTTLSPAASPQPASHATSSSVLVEKQSGTLSSKMRWISAKEASKAVNDFALFVQRKRARMDKKTSGGRNKKYICSCTHCAWFVRLIKVAKSDNWKISSMQLTHSENCTGEAQPSARQLAELNTLRNRVLTASSNSLGILEITQHHDSDEICAQSIRHGRSSGGVGNERRLLVQTDFTAEGESLGVKIPVRLAYRAKKILQENSSNAAFSVEAIVNGVLGLPGRDLTEKIAESYKLLPSLLQKFSDLNPGSAVCLRKDERGRFKSAFVLPAPLTDLLPTLQSVFGLEIVPSGRQNSNTSSANSTAEPPRYTGQFIVLLGMDGNLEHRVVAFGLIPTPDTENVAWFLRSLHNAGFQMGDAPVFLAYHQLGALSALRREFPRVAPMFCVESFIQTIDHQLAGSVSLLNLDFVTHQIRLASLAETLEAFRAHMGVVAQHLPSVASFLLSFDASLWSLHASRAVKKYHWNATGLRTYMSTEVEIVVKTKRPAQQRQPSRSSRGQHELLYVEASSGFDVQRVNGIQLADFDTMVPLEIIYQFLLHYLHVEAHRAVEIANMLAYDATSNSSRPQPLASVQLTPGAEKLFQQELFESEHLKVCASEDPAIALVLSNYASAGDECRVHVDDGRCSCATMYQLGIPCRHLIATARAFKGEKPVPTECDRIYTLAVYRLGVQCQSSLEDRMPALGGLNRDSSIYPAPIHGSTDEAEGAGAPLRTRSSGSSGKRRVRDESAAAKSSAAVATAAKRAHLPQQQHGYATGFSAENVAENRRRNSSSSSADQQHQPTDLDSVV